MAYVVVASRALVAVVFVTSAVAKLRSRAALDELTASLHQFGVPRAARRTVAVGVALAESAVPVLLVGALVAGSPAGGPARAVAGAGFALATGLLAGFTAAIARALRRGARLPCRCFGASSTPLGRRHLVRNGLLLAATVTGGAGVLTGPAGPSALGGTAVAVMAGLVTGALVTMFDDLIDLLTPPPPHPS